MTKKVTYNNKTGRFEYLDVKMWEKRYPGVNISREIMRMENWLGVNPKKEIYERFIVNWLNDSLGKLPTKPQEYNQPPLAIPKRIPRKETKEERDILDKMKALTKGINWQNRTEVTKMTTEMKALQKQYNDLRNAPQ